MTFFNNTSYRGTFLYIDDKKETWNRAYLYFERIKFSKNKAENFGGIIYSNARDEFNVHINFLDCTFENNRALLGIFYINNKYNIKYMYIYIKWYSLF